MEVRITFAYNIGFNCVVLPVDILMNVRAISGNNSFCTTLYISDAQPFVFGKQLFSSATKYKSTKIILYIGLVFLYFIVY
jgi:hypothetical protein